jgi:hypothetical protein
MSTDDKKDTVPAGSAAKNTLGNWISPEDLNKAVQERFPGCMKGIFIFKCKSPILFFASSFCFLLKVCQVFTSKIAKSVYCCC